MDAGVLVLLATAIQTHKDEDDEVAVEEIQSCARSAPMKFIKK